MRRVGIKRSNSEDIGSWDLPPPKRARVDPNNKTGSTVLSRFTSGFGGLFSTVKRWFSRSRVSNSCPPHMSGSSSASPSSSPPSLPPSPLSQLASTPVPPHSSPPHNPPSPRPPPAPVRTHLSYCDSPTSLPVPQQSSGSSELSTKTPPRQKPRQHPQTTSLPPLSAPRSRYNSSNGSRLWTKTQGSSSHEWTRLPKERWSQLFSSPSTSSQATPPVTTHRSPSLIPSPLSPPLPPRHLTSPPVTQPPAAPENIGPKLRGRFISPGGLSGAPPRVPSCLPGLSVRAQSSAFLSLPHSPPPSPLPSSDVVQRRKWVESLKADHTHSLSQHRAAVKLELRHLAVCREQRFRAEDSRVRHLQDSVRNMSLLSDIGHDDEEDEEEEGGEEMAELTEQQLQQVHRVLSRGSGLEVLSQKFNISIKRDDVMTLAGLNWLNDEVINFYMNLIMERGKKEGSVCRVHVMSSFFYPKLCDVGYSGVQRWTKKVDVFSVDLVLYPIHLGTHWCLAAIDNRQRSLAYYDSLGGRGKSCLATLRDYLVSEYGDKKKAELSLNGWSDVPVNNIPLQKNGSDCGVFTCMYARYLSSNSPFTFSQEDMTQIRRHIICELLEQRLF